MYVNKILRFSKNIALDLLSMGKGFSYGFLIFGLFFLIIAAVLYGILVLKNFIL